MLSLSDASTAILEGIPRNDMGSGRYFLLLQRQKAIEHAKCF